MPHHEPRVNLSLGFRNPITIQTGIPSCIDQFKSSNFRIWQLGVLNILSRQRQKEQAPMYRLIFPLVISIWHLSGKLEPQHIHGTAGTHRRSYPGT